MSLILSHVPLASGTWAAQPTGDINMSAYYNLYKIIEVELISILPVTDATDIIARVSVDGTTFDAAASNYRWAAKFNSDAAGTADIGSSADTGIIMNGTGSHIGNGATNGYNSIIKIWNPGVSTFQPQIMYDGTYFNQVSSGNLCRITGSGARVANQVTKGIRFLFNLGNISSGTYRVVGYI